MPVIDCFAEQLSLELFDDREIVTIEYIYHDSSLENNQFYLIYSIIFLNQNELFGQFDIKLSDFGYYKIPSVNETTIAIQCQQT